MDDSELDLNLQLPSGIEVPLKHEKPNTTLESLIQIKSDFEKKITEATEKNDSSKKRRYERQLKQFQDAIKATKDGKSFNYNDLLVPPGFAKIPVNSDGTAITDLRPIQIIKNDRKSAILKPDKPSANFESNNDVKLENDELDDEFLNQLSKEIEINDNDEELDAEDNEFDKMLQDVNKKFKNVDKIIPKSSVNSEKIEISPMELNTLSKITLTEAKERRVDVSKSSTNVQIQPKINNHGPISIKRNNQTNNNLNIILERQRLFKEAAVKAKKEGNINIALVYLKHAKGFDNMITAAENGLPIDMNNLPVPPQLEKKNNQVILESKDIQNENLLIQGDRKQIYQKLEEILLDQIKLATSNIKHFTSMGDVNNSNKFNQVVRETRQDLDALKAAYTNGEPIPLYHYEKRLYQTVDCNPDLTDNELELNIIRAVNLPLPKDFESKHLNTYVKFEFPYPSENVQGDKTNKQSGTQNPEYNQIFKVQIQRKQQKFIRLMNRKDLRLEVYYKAGLLKGDKLLGTANIKLQRLEHISTIHDAFDLLEGRRQTGGKLEVKLRIREPLLHQDIKNMEYKWLIIDNFKIIEK